ncbi:EamA family transporter [Pseudoflavonifractor phocaeensis]|uniref:EamA family transporter n=1 Tax=Pseudoflavonifractor phocaeensis TaxID=1870988 RepID=UPI001F1F4D05|nr:EamA family transporter [Pseudoflavonifractor phocaeensis]MCF2595644.1 EamA family transporter [Pseudoflavonifractor phocaeensis]MDY3905416.1 EamA family transporter [Lawsonibacter sp.]
MYFYLPIITVVCSSVIYHVCAKSTSPKINAFASLAVTYLIGAVVSAALYYLTSPTKRLAEELSRVNWATLVLGLAIVGLEAGNIFMYKVGWDISLGPLVTSSTLAVTLLAVGVLFYREELSLTKVVGIVLCVAGLILVNKK